MKWSKQLCAVLILSLMFIMTSINSTSSVFMEYENPSEHVVRMEPTLDFESFIPSADNETTIIAPILQTEVYYGWVGNYSITYWDANASVGIPDANVSSGMWPLITEVFDLENGTYFVEVNTTYCWSESLYYLMVEFDKSGFENQFIIFPVFVQSIPTDLVVFAPVENQIEEDPTELMIPLGDAIDIQFSYNDTEATNDYPGGLEGADVEGYIGYYVMPSDTLVQHPIEFIETGNGFCNYTFDTTDEWLYLSVGETPVSHYYFYFLHVEFTLPNSQTQECLIRINIIDIPTELVVDPGMQELHFEPGNNSIFVSLIDIWPTHSGVAIQDLNITVESSDPSVLEVISISNVSTGDGFYEITFNNKQHLLSQSDVDIIITVEKEGCQSQEWGPRVFLLPYEDPPGPPIPWGLIFVVFIAGVLILRRRNRLEPSEELPENG